MSDIRNLEINLDIKQNLLVTVNCKQLDSLNLTFNIWDNGLQADLSNYRCRLKALKQDQIPLIQNTDISISGNVVTLEANEQLTTTSGSVKTELQFIEKTTGKKKSTFDLNIKVISSTLEVDRTISKATITLLEELDNKLDQIEDIGSILDEAIIVKQDLNTNIVTANTSKSNLETTTTNANNRKQEVETVITNATTKIAEVNTAITNANVSKIALDTSKGNADTTKSVLDSANTLAEANIEELNKLGDVTDLAIQVQTNTNNIGDLEADKTDIKTTIGTETMGTTATTLKGAIKEHTTQLKDLANSRFINIFSITKNITGKNIKIIGDSITSGVRGTGFAMDGEQFYGEFKENTSGHCWANSLKTYLQTNFNCTVHNYGVGGLNSTDLANNISTFVKNTDDIVLCMVGTNDRQLTNPTTIIQNNIKTIYNYVKNLGKEIIFLSALPALENVETYNCKMKDIDNAIMNVTSSLNLEYISAYKLVVDYLESRDMKLADILSDDYVHPNDNGYDIMFYLILNKLGFSKINSLDYIHDTGWMDIPLSSGITVLDGYAYQYRRIGKQVFLRAPLVGVAQAQQVVGTLPVGFRPNSIHYYASFKNGYQPIACCVNTDGTIVIMGSTDGQYVTGHFYCINTNFAIG